MSPKEGIYFDYDLKANEHVPEGSVCPICDSKLVLRWVEIHGEAVCVSCSCPFRVLHYEDKKLVNTKPTCHLNEAEIAKLRQLWVKANRVRKAFIPLATEALKA